MYTPQEKNEIRMKAALDLARFKMQCQVAKGTRPLLDDMEVNELFVVAGLDLLEPGELDKEVELINIKKEDAE